ncbi:MAG TPA: hypothetical protein PLP33_24885 [Leptospiraceae bacterium]|nr:hypothetical protein [Leptospiraceae bacterium]
MKRQKIHIYSDCSGIHIKPNSKPDYFRLGFVIYDPSLNFDLIKRVYQFRAEDFSYSTAKAEALACLIGMYYFDEYLGTSKYIPVLKFDCNFLGSIFLNKTNKSINTFDLTRELKKYQKKLAPSLSMVSGKNNKAHNFIRSDVAQDI